MKAEPLDEKLRRYKSTWLRHVTRMNKNRVTKITLNYRPHVKRRLGRPMKSIVDAAETGLSRPNTSWLLLLLLLLVVVVVVVVVVMMMMS
jgi:hypothetical protein